jgi:hypothetical protein
MGEVVGDAAPDDAAADDDHLGTRWEVDGHPFGALRHRSSYSLGLGSAT